MGKTALKAPPIVHVRWSLLNGATYEGEVIEVDNNVFVVCCDDGVTRYMEEEAIQDAWVVPPQNDKTGEKG